MWLGVGWTASHTLSLPIDKIRELLAPPVRLVGRIKEITRNGVSVQLGAGREREMARDSVFSFLYLSVP